MATDQKKGDGFGELALTDAVRQALADLCYETPTDVQTAVFVPACEGRDLVVQARTGTGKTTAFGLPLVNSLVRPGTEAVQALILCPTRELALQVAKELGALAKHTTLRVIAVYGGAPLGNQIQALKQGAQIVVGTPGRILDHLERGTLQVGAVRRLVLDESDEMLSMGFLPQITEIWEQLPAQRQVLLFSATVGRDVLRIAESRLKEPVFVTLSGDRVGALEVTHYFYHSQGNKLEELFQVLALEHVESAIIFCNTRDETKRVAQALAARGYAADWLNADLSQNDREKVMQAIRDGKLRFLVATDVAARGIDITHLTHVINFDFPESNDGYVHRTGRTGRAGRLGTAISLVKPGSIGDLYYLKLRYKIDPIERQLPSASEMAAREENDLLDRLASELPPAESMASRLSRRLVTRDDAELLVARLLAGSLGPLNLDVDRVRRERRGELPPIQRPPPVAQNGGASLGSPEPDRRAESAPRGRDGQRRNRGDDRGERREQPSELGEAKSTATRPAPQGKTPVDAVSPAGRPTRHRLGGVSYTVSEPAHAKVADRTAVSTEPRAEIPELSRDVLPAAPEGAKNGADAEPERAVAPATRHAQTQPDRELPEVFVNVGKRDGVTETDIVNALRGRGVELGTSSYVHVRYAHSFLGVTESEVERVIAALDGADSANKQASAERARSSRKPRQDAPAR